MLSSWIAMKYLRMDIKHRSKLNNLFYNDTCLYCELLLKVFLGSDVIKDNSHKICFLSKDWVYKADSMLKFSYFENSFWKFKIHQWTYWKVINDNTWCILQILTISTVTNMIRTPDRLLSRTNIFTDLSCCWLVSVHSVKLIIYYFKT